MKYQKTAKFVGQPTDPNPVTGAIIAVEPSPTYKNAARITLEIAPGERRCLDAWGGMLDALIERSNESNDWIGLRIQILTYEKINEKGKKRTVTVLP